MAEEKISKDIALIEKLNRGHIVESEEEMTPGYKKALIVILTVQGDTELMSAPSYYLAAKDAPDRKSTRQNPVTEKSRMPSSA